MNAPISTYLIREKLFNLAELLQRSLDSLAQGNGEVNSLLIEPQQQVVNPIIQIAKDSLNDGDFLQAAVDLVKTALGTSGCIIIPANTDCSLTDNHLWATSLPGKSLIDIYENLLDVCDYTALVKGETLIYQSTDASLSPVLVEALNIKQISSLVIAPLFYQRSYLGLMGLHHSQGDVAKPAPWSESQLDLIKTIATQCAMVLQHTQLLKKLRQQQKREELLRNLSQTLTSQLTPQEILQQLLQQIGSSFPVERVVLFGFQQEQIIVDHEWCSSAQIPSLRYQETSATQWQLPYTPDSDCQQPPFVTRYGQQAAEFVYDYLNQTDTQWQISALLAVPVQIREQPWGTLHLHTTSQEYHFSGEEIQTAQLVVNQVAIAIEQLQNYEQIQRLEARNEYLENSHRTKSAFFDNTSHELRTPLTSIIGFSRLLGEQIYGPLNDKQMQYITALSNCSDHLLSLINDLLDISKIDAGREQLFFEDDVPVEEVCRASISIVQQQAAQGGLELDLVIDEGITVCSADKRRLKQILVNLLSNAVKFTEDGYVKLQVTHAEQQLLFSVIDTGIGMSQTEQKELFQPFYQINSHLHRKHKGTGLGLALSRKLAQLHGGDIRVSSEPGKGSCFTLSLPHSA